MATTNIGFDRGHPFVEVGANQGSIRWIDGRMEVTASSARSSGFSVERSVDDGVTWEQVLGGGVSAAGANLVDYESLSYGTTLYRAVAFTVEGATAETTVEVTAASEALWLSGGPAYGLTCRLPFDPQKKITTSRARALKWYAGRSRPVAVSGDRVTTTVAIAGNTNDLDGDTASAERLTELAQLPDPLFLFRDPDGRRIYGQIDTLDLSWDRSDPHEAGYNSWWGYSCTLTEAT